MKRFLKLGVLSAALLFAYSTSNASTTDLIHKCPKCENAGKECTKKCAKKCDKEAKKAAEAKACCKKGSAKTCDKAKAEAK